MKKHWKDLKNSYFQEKVSRQLKKKHEFFWTRLLNLKTSPQSWKNAHNSNKFKSWKIQKKLEKDFGKGKKTVKNMKQSVKKEKSSNSDIRLWCWKKSSKLLSNYSWNANIYALLKKTWKFRSEFLKKTLTKWRCHQTFKKMPLKSKLGSQNWATSWKIWSKILRKKRQKVS